MNTCIDPVEEPAPELLLCLVYLPARPGFASIAWPMIRIG